MSYPICDCHGAYNSVVHHPDCPVLHHMKELEKQLTEAREKLRTDCPLATDGTCKDLTALEQENKRLREALVQIEAHGIVGTLNAGYKCSSIAEQALKKEVE